MQNSHTVSGLADISVQGRLQTEVWSAIGQLTTNLARTKLIEEGWLPKTTQVDICLMSMDNQRSVASLCTTLLRRVLKSTPYIEHLVNYQTEKLVSSKQGNMVVRGYVYSERAVLQLRRYLRYLNYLLRKHRMPLTFSLVTSTNVDGMSMKKVLFTCALAASYPLSRSDTNSTRICLSESDLQARFQEIERLAQETFGNPDAAYSHRAESLAQWAQLPISSVAQLQYNALRVGKDTNYSLSTVERVFFLLPHILKFVENLTRKLVYGPSAFTVVSRENPVRDAESAISAGGSEQPTSAIQES